MKIMLDKILSGRIDKKLALINKSRPLPPSLVKKLQEQFKIEMTYNSNAIEGNKLTFRETFLVISEGITIKNKSLKDHLEAKDHYEALDYLYSLVEKDHKQTFSESTIRNLHKIVVLETEKEWAGRYRNGNVIIGGADHQPPDQMEIPRMMHELMVWFKENKNKLHPVELAALFHHKLVYIHPFFDGNGRTSRLVMNLLLMSHGYPLVIVLKNDRKRYYRTLQMADVGEYKPFIDFIAQAVERTLDIYLKVLIPTTSTTEKYITLSELAKMTPFSEKYLNLLARTGKLEAHKMKRNWLSTHEAFIRYQQTKQKHGEDKTIVVK